MTIFKPFAAMKGYLLFWLTFMCVWGTIAYAFKHSDAGALSGLPIILGIYAGASFGKQASAHWAAMKDADADTAKVIADVNEK